MLTEPQTLDLACSTGTHKVSIGDRFSDYVYGGEWEVVGWSGGRIYSPSGLGGTPIVVCKPIGDVPEYWRHRVAPDGTVEWCGDSVSHHIHRCRSRADRR